MIGRNPIYGFHLTSLRSNLCLNDEMAVMFNLVGPYILAYLCPNEVLVVARWNTLMQSSINCAVQTFPIVSALQNDRKIFLQFNRRYLSFWPFLFSV